MSEGLDTCLRLSAQGYVLIRRRTDLTWAVNVRRQGREWTGTGGTAQEALRWAAYRLQKLAGEPTTTSVP